MIQIDFEYLKKCRESEHRIFTSNAIGLFLLYNKEYTKALEWYTGGEHIELEKIKLLLTHYQEHGYLKIVGDLPEGIEWRKKYLDLLPTESKQSILVDEWINNWRELWPSGVKSGGYYVKSNKEDLLNKMNKFIKKYKFTKEQIFEATINYLNEQKSKGWGYTKLANYFIDKDNVSILASYCANIGSKVEGKKDYGELV